MRAVDIDKDFKRRVRIQNSHEWDVSIHDADTGEAINNVTKLVITLDVEGDNTVEVTYEKPDTTAEDGYTHETTVLKSPEIDVVAWETRKERKTNEGQDHTTHH